MVWTKFQGWVEKFGLWELRPLHCQMMLATLLLAFLPFDLSNTIVASRGSESVPLSLERGMLGIIWSCASTLVLSAWVTARPNVVPQSSAVWERLKRMIGIILAPELILACSVKHLYSAIRITFKFEGWTLTHAYFLIMGGFSVLDQHNESRVLTFEDFDRGFSVYHDEDVLAFDFHRGTYVKGEESGIPIFNFQHGFSVLATEDSIRSVKQETTPTKIILGEINHRSKRDWVLQLIGILYSLHFVVQYGVRVHYGSASTELEFATLVLVIFHAIIYGVWWYKPIEVHGAEKRTQFNPSDLPDYSLFLLQACTLLFICPFRSLYPAISSVVETSGYILKIFRRIPPAIFHFSEKGLRGIVNLPVLCIGFLLLLTFSPFALALAFALAFVRSFTDLLPPVFRPPTFASTNFASIISEIFEMVISVSQSAQEIFNSILEAPNRTPFGVTRYILFIPLLPFVIYHFLLFLCFALLLLAEQPINGITQTIFTDSFNRDAHVPIAPFPKDARYHCLVATIVIGLTFFGLRCIGWDFQSPYDSELRMSWRVACLVISAIPVIAILLILILKGGNVLISSDQSPIILILWLSLSGIARLLFVVYACARISLIPQAIILLIRTQQSGVVPVPELL